MKTKKSNYYDMDDIYSRWDRQKVILIADDYAQPIVKDTPLPFLPVLNKPLIHVVLDQIIKQKLTNIIFCVKTEEMIDKIEDYINECENFKTVLKPLFMVNDTIGNCMRDIDMMYEDDYFIYVDMSFFTNTDMKVLFDQLKKDKESVLEAHLFPYEEITKEKRSIFNLYGFMNKKRDGYVDLVYYESESKKNEKVKEYLVECVQKNKNVSFRSDLVRIGVAAIKKHVLALFSEHFEINNMDDLIEKVLAFNVYNYKFGGIITENKKGNKKNKMNDTFRYNKLIRSTKDLFDLNKDMLFMTELRESMLKDGKEMFQQENGNLCSTQNNQKAENSCLGSNLELEKDVKIKNSFVGEKSKIKSDVENCIIFPNTEIKIESNVKNKIVIGEEQIEIEEFDEPQIMKNEEDDKNSEKKDVNFFKDLTEYLHFTLGEYMKKKVELEAIARQIRLLKIVWNASHYDLVEAFANFIGSFVDENDFEGSTIMVSNLFPALTGQTKDFEVQKHFIIVIKDSLDIKNKRSKSHALLRIAFLLLEEGIVSRDALQKSKVVKGYKF